MSPSPEVDVEQLLENLVRIDSQNPDLAPDSRGEKELAVEVARLLDAIGAKAQLHETLEGRPNVVGVLPGSTDETLVFEAHLDTVPAPPGPLVVRREGRRLHGRGTCDTKGSLAAMLAAVARLAQHKGPRPTVVLAGVVDEEYVMRGAARLLDQIPAATGVVIGEPTLLVPARAHNGFIRVRIHVRGLSVHSSKAHLGHNAVLAAARLVDALEQQLGERLRHRHHPLAGPALLTPTMISGGIAPNVVPDHCAVWFDRRLAPGEEPADALAEIDGVLDGLRSAGDVLDRDDPIVSLRGVETAQDHLLVRATERAVRLVTGEDRSSTGVTYSTDACYLGGAGGLPCVVLGPGSIDQAHTVDEWIDLDQVVQAVAVYTHLALELTPAAGPEVPA
jgi:acetylornithine deacetylase/succinyl-diaminopimelate desuccinylase-like protein